MTPTFRYDEGVREVRDQYLDAAVAALDELKRRPKSERYKIRRELYGPGDLLSIPTHPAFGGHEGRALLAVLASCNWLGNVHIFLTCQVIRPGDEVDPPASDQVVEAWSSGDSMVLAEIFANVGAIPNFDLGEWPLSIGPPPVGQSGLWSAHFRPRKQVFVQDSADGLATRHINLFQAGIHDEPIVRASELIHGKPFDRWPVPGGRPGSMSKPFLVHQDW